MGRNGDNDRESARARTNAYLTDARKPSPIPLEECPWCGTKFKPLSFKLLPNNDEPTGPAHPLSESELRISGRGVSVAGAGSGHLDPIYRRLPCFVIATVDKFAGLALGWPGGRLLRACVSRYDAKAGFFGPCDNAQGAAIPGGRLLPPRPDHSG